MNLNKIVGILIPLSSLVSLASCGQQDYQIVKDCLIEMPVYNAVDYAYAQEYFKTGPIQAGACSAIVKNIGNNHLLVGRNMDFGISNKSAYIVRTAEKDKYKTLGFAYATNSTSPDFDKIKSNGLTDQWRRLIPFFCTDIINEKGLYCEIDMRNVEKDESGKSIFRCSGTKPETGVDVHMVALTRFIVSNCKDVDEAVSYVKTKINVFNNAEDWNFSFILADASGKHGLLEFGSNNVYWNEGKNCQTNYFLTEELASISKIKFGKGRYDYLTDPNRLSKVNDISSMYSLINEVRYSNVYKGKDYCPFDMRSETYDFFTEERAKDPNFDILSKENEELVWNKINGILDEFNKLSEEEKRKKPWYWQSTFTEVVDVFNKTIHIRFFENEQYTFDYLV